MNRNRRIMVRVIVTLTIVWVIMLGNATRAMSAEMPVSIDEKRISEDSNLWDCRVMGNGLCGNDLISQSYDPTIRPLKGRW